MCVLYNSSGDIARPLSERKRRSRNKRAINISSAMTESANVTLFSSTPENELDVYMYLSSQEVAESDADNACAQDMPNGTVFRWVL